MAVLFICPRPVALVTATFEDRGNMFPMNLMGSIGNGYFAFALNNTRPASHLVKRAGRIALSTIPLEHAELARRFGRNHKLEYSNWNELPFPTKLSPVLHIPVPCFTLRVREMEIEANRKLEVTPCLSRTPFATSLLQVACSSLWFMGRIQARRQRNGCQATGRISSAGRNQVDRQIDSSGRIGKLGSTHFSFPFCQSVNSYLFTHPFVGKGWLRATPALHATPALCAALPFTGILKFLCLACQ